LNFINLKSKTKKKRKKIVDAFKKYFIYENMIKTETAI